MMAMTVAPTMLIELKRRARDAATRAYAPYSRFPVGAAVLAADGAIHAAANVENASFGLSICAERAAIFQAIAHGAHRIEAVVIYTPTTVATAPCGACRQVLHEFGPEALIVACTEDERAERSFTLPALLPDPFGSGSVPGPR